jgi:hypothetical protein
VADIDLPQVGQFQSFFRYLSVERLSSDDKLNKQKSLQIANRRI